MLPFENSSDENANGYFVSGIHDHPWSIFQYCQSEGYLADFVMPYRTGARDLRAIGRELGTRTVVEGSVRREGSRAALTRD